MSEVPSVAALRALEILGTNRAFKGVTASHLAEMREHARTSHFAAETVLMHQGATSDCLHILVSGHVRINRDGEQTELLAELGPGDVVGEMGVLTGAPRSATVTAIDDVETLELNAEELKEIFREDHLVLLGFIKVMHDRLHPQSNS